MMNATDAYEQHALEFLEVRDRSNVGAEVVEQWARSLRPGAEVIELACGGGLPVTRALVGAGLQVRAIDASPTLVAKFTSRFPNVPVQCNSVQDSDFFARKYHAAVAIGLVFLFPESEQLAVIDKMSQYLRPGGRLLFTAPIEIGTWKDVVTGHDCESLGQTRYEAILRQSGLEVIATYEDEGANNYYEARKWKSRSCERGVNHSARGVE